MVKKMKNNKNKPSFNEKITNSKFDFVKNLKWFFAASCALIVAGIFVIIFAGFNLGIDFTGGTVLQIELGDTISTTEGYNNSLNTIKNILSDNKLKLSTSQKGGEAESQYISIKYQDIKGHSEEEMGEVTLAVRQAINEAFDVENFVEVGDDFDITEGTERISATARNELLFNALVAIIVSMTLILVYIAFRFEPLSGIASILGLLHDVLITLALVAIFRIQINTAFVAAIITVIGYSINNTIVVFDRLRENSKKPSLTDKTNKELVNISLKQTLVRSINTAVTTLFAIVALCVLGVPSIREFVIAIIFGLVAGTYSSLFLVGPFWAIVNKQRKLTKPKTQSTNIEEDQTENLVDSNAPIVEIEDK